MNFATKNLPYILDPISFYYYYHIIVGKSTKISKTCVYKSTKIIQPSFPQPFIKSIFPSRVVSAYGRISVSFFVGHVSPPQFFKNNYFSALAMFRSLCKHFQKFRYIGQMSFQKNLGGV